jgi:hypothetical protein
LYKRTEIVGSKFNTVNTDIKENSKRLWSYIKSKRQEPAGISPLLNKDGLKKSGDEGFFPVGWNCTRVQ